MERKTQQRQAILDVFGEASRPLSVQEIHDQAKGRCRGIGIATVYRNLKALVDDGTLLSVEMPGGLVLYEIPSKEHHHHFSCLSCQKVFDINVCGLNFQKLIPPGFQLQEHEVFLSGFCNLCASSG